MPVNNEMCGSRIRRLTKRQKAQKKKQDLKDAYTKTVRETWGR